MCLKCSLEYDQTFAASSSHNVIKKVLTFFQIMFILIHSNKEFMFVDDFQLKKFSNFNKFYLNIKNKIFDKT